MMNIVNYDYMPSDCLERLQNYKYIGTDNSLLYNYLLSPFANFCLNFTPRWIA